MSLRVQKRTDFGTEKTNERKGDIAMPIGLVGGAISGVGSLIGGLMNSSAASTAAQQEAAAGRAAASGQQTAGQQATNEQTTQLQNENKNSQPFVGAGQNATLTLGNLLTPGGGLNNGGFAA